MKNKKFSIINFVILALAYALLASAIFEPSVAMFGGAVALAFVSGTAMSFLPKGTFGAIQVEVWQNVIQEELFKNNEFLQFSVSQNDNVLDGRVVHLPQSGGSGNVEKNRSSLPATVRQRTDTDVVYVLDEYTTDPVHIKHADTVELSYDKVASVLREDTDKLAEEVAEEVLYSWLHSGAFGTYGATAFPAANVLLTTGANGVANASAVGATGNRKMYTRADLQRMQTKFRQEKRWFNEQMYCLLDPLAAEEMFPVNDIITATYMNQVTEEERRMGILYKANGWKILIRSTVARVTAAGAILAPGAAGSATDDGASLFWYSQAVEHALGTVRAFENIGDPTFYGDIYSFLVRMGGRARRAGYSGIAVLKQAKTA
jgi:hypothetical protein